MRVLKFIGGSIKNFMIIFSFIVNLVLIIVLVVLGLLIFDIKNNIAVPLVAGLHSSFVGLDQSTIDWTIPVRDTIPVVLNNVPINASTIVTPPQITLNGQTVDSLPGETKVVLTRAVPLNVTAVINLPGVGTLNNAQVNLELPAGLELPVSLDFGLNISQQLPVALDVRAVIPLHDTQLHDPVNNLRLLFEPLTRALYNLPGNFNEVPAFVSDLLDGSPPNLLADNAYSDRPWPGYSQTAGVNYTLGDTAMPTPNRPLETGITQTGGIPALDQQLRPDVYQQGGPVQVNQQAEDNLAAQGIPAWSYDGSYYQQIQPVAVQPTGVPVQPTTAQNASPSNGQTNSTPTGNQTATTTDAGIVSGSESSTPSGGAQNNATPGPPATENAPPATSEFGTGGPEVSPTQEGDMGILPTGSPGG